MPGSDLERTDLTDPALFADGPPHDLLGRLRDEAPVHWNDAAGGFWAVTRHADIAAASRDTDTFSSYADGIFPNRDQVVPLDLARNLLLFKDPPEHTKYRRILQTAFVPNTVAALEDRVRLRVTNAIDAFIETGSCDFVADVAVPVPLGMLAELMGVADDDIPTLGKWVDAIEEAQRDDEGGTALPTFVEMAGFLQEQIARQIESGEESLVTRLREAEVDGERLTDDEILVFFGLLVFAGNDTTRNTTAQGMHALLGDRDQWEALCADPALIENAVEEILRFTSVVNWFCRTATTDTALAGQPVAKGEKVMLWYTSGSRDESVCPHADRLDVARADVKHMAFGGGGRHFCLGAGLARLELRVLFEELTRRIPDARIAGPVERLSSTWANALTSLPLEFSPGPREG